MRIDVDKWGPAWRATGVEVQGHIDKCREDGQMLGACLFLVLWGTLNERLDVAKGPEQEAWKRRLKRRSDWAS